MDPSRDLLVDAIRRRSECEAARLAGEFARAAAGDRELILAEMEFERWLAEGCDEALSDLP